jgi:hypothetical protein
MPSGQNLFGRQRCCAQQRIIGIHSGIPVHDIWSDIDSFLVSGKTVLQGKPAAIDIFLIMIEPLCIEFFPCPLGELKAINGVMPLLYGNTIV